MISSFRWQLYGGKKSFTGLIGKGRIAAAFKNAAKDDVNHQHDGHRKFRTNKL